MYLYTNQESGTVIIVTRNSFWKNLKSAGDLKHKKTEKIVAKMISKIIYVSKSFFFQKKDPRPAMLVLERLLHCTLYSLNNE